MKNLRICVLLLVIVAFTNMQCEKSNTEKKDELPAETQEGKNTFGCLVDGKVWLPKSGGTYPPLSSTMSYSIDLLALGYDSFIHFRILETELFEGKTIPLLSNQAWMRMRSKEFKSAQGALKISKYDKAKQIMAGSFYFTAKSDEGDSVIIKDGRFDISYH